MQLDDLDGLEEPGSLRGEPHHEDGGDAEVRRDQHPDTRGSRQELLHGPVSDQTSLQDRQNKVTLIADMGVSWEE